MSTGTVVLIVAIVVIAIAVATALVVRSKRQRRRTTAMGLPDLGALATDGLDKTHTSSSSTESQRQP